MSQFQTNHCTTWLITSFIVSWWNHCITHPSSIYMWLHNYAHNWCRFSESPPLPYVWWKVPVLSILTCDLTSALRLIVTDLWFAAVRPHKSTSSLCVATVCDYTRTRLLVCHKTADPGWGGLTTVLRRGRWCSDDESSPPDEMGIYILFPL